MYKIIKWDFNRLIERIVPGTSIGNALESAGWLYDASVISVELLPQVD